jgi:hypothetical protein
MLTVTINSIMLSVIMLSDIIMNVVMLNVVAPSVQSQAKLCRHSLVNGQYLRGWVMVLHVYDI